MTQVLDCSLHASTRAGNVRQWARVLALYSASIVTLIAGIVVLLATSVTTTVYVTCAPRVNGTVSCPPVTEYVVSPAVPVLWTAAVVYFVAMSFFLLSRGRWLITRPNVGEIS